MISPDRTIINQLIDFGLTEKEAIIYLVSIESGPLPAQKLSKNSGINRSTTYVVLDSLIAKGLIRKSKNDTGISVYEALEPETLLKEAAEIEQRRTKIHKDIDALIPELTALSSALALHPRLKFYEGKDGIETAEHDLATIESQEIVRAFTVKPVLLHCKNGQTTHIISPYKGEKMTESKDKILSIHFIPADQYNFSSDIRIYANKIVLISEHEGFAVIIEDKYFAEVMKETFDLAWEEAKRLNTQIRATNKH